MTTTTSELKERLIDFLFAPDIGDEIVLTKSGRLKAVVEVTLVADNARMPMPSKLGAFTRSGAMLELARIWAEASGDQLID